MSNIRFLTEEESAEQTNKENAVLVRTMRVAQAAEEERRRAEAEFIRVYNVKHHFNFRTVTAINAHEASCTKAARQLAANADHAREAKTDTIRNVYLAVVVILLVIAMTVWPAGLFP